MDTDIVAELSSALHHGGLPQPRKQREQIHLARYACTKRLQSPYRKVLGDSKPIAANPFSAPVLILNFPAPHKNETGQGNAKMIFF
jgi:hypothetical protein